MHKHQHKTSGLFSKVLSHLLLLSPRKTVESRAHKLPVGCRDKPGLGPLNHSAAVWFGAVVRRISIQITILPVRDKQGKVVTGVKTLIDVLDTATRCLARMRAVGLSFSWTRGPGRFVNSTRRTRTQQVKVGLHSNFKYLALLRHVSKLIGPIPFNRIIQGTPSQACSTCL